MKTAEIKTGTRHRGFALSLGALAADDERVAAAGDRHILNSGGAYDGEMVLTSRGRLRLSPKDELPMLAQHDREAILGAWTDLRVDVLDGRPLITAGDNRFLEGDDLPEVRKYRQLWDQDFIWAQSIGFDAVWYWASEINENDPDLGMYYNEAGGWVLDDWEVHEASLVTVAADANSKRGGLCLADGATPVRAAAALDLDDDEQAEAAVIAAEQAGELMVSHLKFDHGMTDDEAREAVRAMLAGERAEPEDDTEGDDVPEDDEEAPGEDVDPEEGQDNGGEEEAESAALFDVPQEVRDAAQEGLDDADAFERADDGRGVEIAALLVAGQVDAEVVAEMVGWWARFFDTESGEAPEGEPSNMEIRWKQWGGKPGGRDWAESVDLESEEEATDTTDATAGDREDEEMATDPPKQTLADLFPARDAGFASWWRTP